MENAEEAVDSENRTNQLSVFHVDYIGTFSFDETKKYTFRVQITKLVYLEVVRACHCMWEVVRACHDMWEVVRTCHA